MPPDLGDMGAGAGLIADVITWKGAVRKRLDDSFGYRTNDYRTGLRREMTESITLRLP